MNPFESEINRIRNDVNCGGKIGLKSALRLLNVLDEMAKEMDWLRRATGARQVRSVRGPQEG